MGVVKSDAGGAGGTTELGAAFPVCPAPPHGILSPFIRHSAY